MPTIFVKDDLRASVEAASGGKTTVLYTATGQPSYMNIVPKFNLEDIDESLGTGVHPAFIVGGVEKSELFIGTYQGIVKNGEFLSLPGVIPSYANSFEKFVNWSRANGDGWHLISNVEFTALALWCWKNGFMPRGNNNSGRSSLAKWETCLRTDGGSPGVPNYTLGAVAPTGSGPMSWRHDNSAGGISDLCGNVSEWSPGLRIVSGEIQVIENNNAALNATDFSKTSSAWKAIDGKTGALIAPKFTGTIDGGNYVPTTENSVRYDVSGTENYTLVLAKGKPFATMTNPGATPVSGAALVVLKKYGLYPASDTEIGGSCVSIDAVGERIAFRGGCYDTIGAGVFALSLDGDRGSHSFRVGSRPAFVL